MIKEIKNLKTLEDAFEGGLKRECPICLVYGEKKSNGILVSKREVGGEIFLTTAEENYGSIGRELYKITKDRIEYQGPLDGKPEDANRIRRLKDALYEQNYKS